MAWRSRTVSKRVSLARALTSTATSASGSRKRCRRTGNQVLYLDVIESSHTFRLASQIGSHRPVYCTGLGKALAAFLSPDKMEELLAGLAFERSTPRTIVQRSKFRLELAKVRKRGYAIDDQEAVLGARCVAAPIFAPGPKVIAAISVSGPSTRVNGQRLSQFATLLKESASFISARLPADGSRMHHPDGAAHAVLR